MNPNGSLKASGRTVASLHDAGRMEGPCSNAVCQLPASGWMSEYMGGGGLSTNSGCNGKGKHVLCIGGLDQNYLRGFHASIFWSLVTIKAP